ncbi:ATP-dependent DNA helicase RecQ [Marinobacterium nitratireducens]|uniref:ATP-dependent DNA helicase RecQ n=1 Tax=Marinobacterium nitratireducens TaxID=518897 RepID=A0A918DTQ5_9GAMM|nr:ATP-dependent DNA helicase RecQ [Marinobacterium nitratireducens]GGO82976.1 ATP-dependent DNA helicase RecQ [Marinobacterium nitratireducens]
MTEALQVLKSTFGLEAFRAGQQEAIDRLLAGESALTVFPTGGGKSLCYQLPALLIDGLTLVVSPLIALMQDQVAALQARGIAAARLDSSRSGDEVREIYRQLRAGELRLLYVAPERLQNARFLSLLQGLQIGLMAVDEAHCISEWGHNFRPDYLKLAQLARDIGVQRVLALTATATPSVAADICRQFGIPPRNHIQTGFYRPNLALGVSICREDDRLALLLQRLAAAPEAATIVYVTLQQQAERLASQLQQAGIRAQAYHAGMKAELRESIQNAFMAGETSTVVATIAFGMGIDKADIRAVYHYHLPKSLENYMQEIGRAGRDGQPSRCELFACPDDVRVLENFTYGDTPVPEHLQGLVGHLLTLGERFDISTYELSNRFDIRPLVIGTVLTYLELEGVIAGLGPFYSTYQIRFEVPEEEIVARFDPRRADFLQRLFAAGKQGRVWLTLDVTEAAAALDEPRERLLKALQYLEQEGLIGTQVKGVRQQYRRLQQPDLNELGARLGDLFVRREEQSLARLQQVLDYAADTRCLPAQLCGYFGDELAQPCGQCTSCLDPSPRVLPRQAESPLTEVQKKAVAALIAEGQEALRHPRQLARFLCGLSSPAAFRLRRHAAYGSLASQPFRQVLDEAQAQLMASSGSG